MIRPNTINHQPGINGFNGALISLVVLAGITYVLKVTHVFDWYLPQIIGIFLAIVTLPKLLIEWLQNRAVEFEYNDKQIMVKKGLIMKNTIVVNYRNASAAAADRNLFDLLTGLATFKLWTYDLYPDIILYLKKSDAELLKKHIMLCAKNLA